MTALMAWPNFHREMEGEVDNQMAALAATRTPNLHRANEPLLEECGWKGGDRVALGAKEEQKKDQKSKQPLPFLSGGMVTERPRCQGFADAAKNAPLTAPGRSANPPPGRKGRILGRQIKIYLTWTGLLMEGHSAH